MDSYKNFAVSFDKEEEEEKRRSLDQHESFDKLYKTYLQAFPCWLLLGHKGEDTRIYMKANFLKFGI
jgi:hypothetical protein